MTTSGNGADAPRCQGVSRGGKPCSAQPLRGDAYCVWHAPDRADDRRAWAVSGGRAKSSDARARKRVLGSARGLDEIDAALCRALRDVLAGTLEPSVATAAAGLARAVVAVRQVGAIEQRLAALEARDRGARHDSPDYRTA